MSKLVDDFELYTTQKMLQESFDTNGFLNMDIPSSQSVLGIKVDSLLKPADTLTRVAEVSTITNPVPIKYGDTSAIDSFARLRVSNPEFRFDGRFVYGISSDNWDQVASGSGSSLTWDSTNRWTQLTAVSSGSNSGYARLQSHYHAIYTPGRSQLILMTGLFGSTPGSGALRRAGYRCIADDLGIYLEQTYNSVNFVLKGKTSYPTQIISQSQWNIDKFDGTGTSGVTLDLTKVQILVIDLQALYAGRVRCGFDVNGIIFWAHQFLHSNFISYPYIQNASLPISYECYTTGPTVSMNALCSSAMSEGGVTLNDIPGREFTVNTVITPIAVTTRRSILTIRAKATLNGVMQHIIGLPLNADLLADAEVLLELVRNPSALGGTPTFSDVDTSNSAMEYSTNVTTVTEGTIIYSSYVPATTGKNTNIASAILTGRMTIVYSHLLQQGDVLSLVATSITGTANTLGSLTWKEVR